MENVPSRWNSRSTWRDASAPASCRSDSFLNVGTATVLMPDGPDGLHA